MQWNPEIHCSSLSMALCQTAGADATVNKSLKNKPLSVLMVRYFLWPSISVDMHSENQLLSFRKVGNISSTRGSRYWSILMHWFMVFLKSLHILTVLSLFVTTTIGVVHSQCSTGSRISKLKSLSNYPLLPIVDGADNVINSIFKSDSLTLGCFQIIS